MLNNLSFSTLTTTVSNLWNSAKSYVSLDSSFQHDIANQNIKNHSRIGFKRLLVLATVGLFSATRNQAAVSLGLVTLFAESVNAAYPTVANPIPTQYVQAGQTWSFNTDLNYVFNDADGDIMTFGGVTMADGSPLPSWLTASPIKLSGRDYANEAWGVDVVGDLAYVANGQSGLLIFNISNSNQKVFVGSYDTPGVAYGITVQNSVAYVADWYSGLQLINVSNASNPTLLGRYDTPGYARGVTVQNGVAYVADLTSGLQLINVSNASNPSLLGTYNTPGQARGVTVQNGVAYVADESSGLQLINVSNANNLTLLGTYVTPGFAFGITVQNGVAYVADESSGLQLINVSNASNPSLLGTYDTPGQAFGVTVQNGVAYVADYTSGLQLINVSNASNPSLLGMYDTPGNAYGVTVQNGVAYVADETSSLQFINVSNSSNPSLLGTYNTPGNAYGVTVQNGVAYVADNTFGLQLINVSNASNPSLLRTYDTPGAALGVTVQNVVAYVADGVAGLQLINVSNVNNPTLLSQYTTLGYAYDVIIQGEIVYLADDDLGLQLINVTDAKNPAPLGNYNTSGFALSVKVENGVAYVVDYSDGLQIINVSDINNLTLLNNRRTPGYAQGIDLQNNIVYLANDNSLQFINVSDVANAMILGGFPIPSGSALGITIQNNIAYVAAYDAGILFINVTDINNPKLLSSYDTPGYASRVTIQEQIAYVADRSGGLQILNLGQTKLVGALPLDVTGNYSFRIHATNINSEWISTDFQLHVFVSTPTTTPTPTPSSTTTSINMPPVLQNNTLIITKGARVTLTPQQLNAVDDITPAPSLEFIVSQVTHGNFQNNNNLGNSIYSFTQQKIQDREIQFVHDGSNNPPSYQVYVNDGTLSSLPQWAAVTFDNATVPVLVTNQITITQGQTVVLNSTNLQASDADNANPNSLLFTVTDIQHGFFANSTNPSLPITSFAQGDINAGTIQFTHDNSTNYPSYYVSVSDRTSSTVPSLVNIRFNNNSVPIILNNQITVVPGQSTVIRIENIAGLDLDGNSNNLVFIITNITGSQFELIDNPGVAITQFSLQDIIDGNVQFTPDDFVECQNSTTPSYSLQTRDSSVTSLVSIAEVDYQQTTTSQGCVITTTETDNTNIYIGVGVSVGTVVLAITTLGIFSVRRKHQLEREAERIEEMADMAGQAAYYKNQPQTENTEEKAFTGTSYVSY